MDRYDRGGHTKYSLKVHLIFVAKYRKHIFAGRFDSDLKEIICNVATSIECHIDIIETDKDHIHMLVSYPPKHSISFIAKMLKQQSSYAMWKHYDQYLLKYYWKRHILWSEGYFACSVGQASQTVIEQYIMTQG